MKKIIFTTICTSLLIFSFLVPSVIADEVLITIKGGFGCNIIIQNNKNCTIRANVSIICHRIFREGKLNSTGKNIPIEKDHSFRARVLPPGIDSVYAMAQVGNQTVIRKGISFFYFVFLFR
jgi:hypothetical protein